MESNPEASEMIVYRSVVGKVMRIQKQLEKCYHGYRYLRGQFMTVIDIPAVQDSLKDRVPIRTQLVVNRVAKMLSERHAPQDRLPNTFWKTSTTIT